MPFDVKDFLAGWMGGVSSIIVSHPFDTIKVRQQAFDSNVWTAIRRTFTHEGIRGFYKGMMFPLLTYGPSNSLFFGVYGNCKRQMEPLNTKEHDISPTNIAAINRVFVAGCIGGFVQTVVYCPVEYIKIILQANTEGKGSWKKHYNAPYTGTIEALLGIYKSRGVIGLYKGFWSMFLRDVPTSGIYVLTYEMLRYSTFEGHSFHTMWKEVIAGGSAGLTSIVTVLPIDVVKTHIQTDNPYKPLCKGVVDCFRQLYLLHGVHFFFKGIGVTDNPKRPNYKGMIDCLRKLRIREGLSSLFKGLPILCFRSIFGHSAVFVIFAQTMSYFE